MAGRTSSETRTVVVDKAVDAAERRRKTSQGKSTPNTNANANTSTSSEPYDQQNIKVLGVVLDDSQTKNETPLNHHDVNRPLETRVPREDSDVNRAGAQTMSGVINNTGITDGNGNGTVCFGNMNFPAAK